MSDIDKKYFLVKLRFHLGYSIRKPFASASIDSYIIPPKSTIIGAIAMANSARNGIHTEYFYDQGKKGDIYSYSNAYLYKDCIKYVAYSYKYKPINFMSMIRMSLHLYNTRTSHPLESMYKNRFGPLYVGITSYYNELLKVFLIIERECEKKYKITLDKKDLYSITRLGSKESVVSVVEVHELNQNNIEKISKKDHIINNIKFSFPKDIKGIDLNHMVGSYFIESVIEDEEGITYSISGTLQIDSLRIKTYIVPNPMVSVTTKGNESLCLFKTTEGNIIAPGELC